MSNYYGQEYPPQREGQYYGAPQQTYGGYENNYGTYQPPQDNSYRQEDMAVTRYDSERARSRDNGRYRDDRYQEDDRYDERSRSRGRGYYDDRQVAQYDDRRYGSRERSRGSRGGDRGFSDSQSFEEVRERSGNGDHHKGKELGAGALGAAIGGFAGHEFGHNKMATTIGALAGAWGGYELEKRHEKKKERRDSEKIVEYSNDYNSRRGLSGSRSRSRRGSEYDDDEYQRRYDERRSDRY